eukprot:2936726-Prymnesium_polylepis.1
MSSKRACPFDLSPSSTATFCQQRPHVRCPARRGFAIEGHGLCPPHAKLCRLSFSGCWNLTPLGLQALEGAFPRLTHLGFSGCAEEGQGAFEDLGPAIASLTASFRRLEVLEYFKDSGPSLMLGCEHMQLMADALEDCRVLTNGTVQDCEQWRVSKGRRHLMSSHYDACASKDDSWYLSLETDRVEWAESRHADVLDYFWTEDPEEEEEAASATGAPPGLAGGQAPSLAAVAHGVTGG